MKTLLLNLSLSMECGFLASICLKSAPDRNLSKKLCCIYKLSWITPTNQEVALNTKQIQTTHFH